MIFAPTVHAVEIIPITSFDPDTFFADGITAGIDFDTDSSSDPGFQAVTQAGFLSVPANNNLKDYNVTHNGITFDIKTINANQSNQSRWRNNANAGDLMNDFQQWYGIHATEGNAVEAAITLTGLLPNTDYQITFFTANVGAGQTTHKFYEGTSSADPLITTFSTSGNQNNYAAWVPGITFQINSGSDSEIAVTIQATESATGDTFSSRLTFDGMSVISLGPAPVEDFQLAITPTTPPATGFDFTWESQDGKLYDLVTSTDLATPILEWPVYDPDGEGGNDPYADIPATGTTTTLMSVPGDGPRRFFAMIEKDAPPLFSEDFEAGDGGFTLVGAPNDWAWGTPNSDNGAGLTLTEGNGGSTNSWGTNLGTGGNPSGTIDPAADSILRSPPIDLTGVTGAQLSFAAAYDAQTGDVIEVLVRDAGTNALLATINPVTATLPDSSGWTTLGPFDLSAADNTNIHLEFRYQGTDPLFIGLYIDDVTVSQ